MENQRDWYHFLNRLDIRRQDESWSSATFVDIGSEKLDLTKQFTKITEDAMLLSAKTRWESPDVAHDKITIDHPTYNARCLGHVILGSITDELTLTIIGRINENYRNDGPLLLWYICNNIHRNNIAFTETIKTKIRTATLSQFHDDVPKYVSFLRDNLRLITITDDSTTQHTDLLTYIFKQLSTCAIPAFKDSIQKWHVDYLEAKMIDLTPVGLIKMADDKVQVLQHANQWIDVDSPAVMALKMELQRKEKDQDTLEQHIMAHITKISNNRNKDRPYQHPEWMTTPPHSITEIYKMMNGSQYVWCTKCRRGNGLWVCTHSTETHTDGYRRDRTKPRIDTPTSRHSQDHQNQPPSPYPNPPRPAPRAQLSIADCLDAYFGKDNITQDTHQP